MKMEVDALNNVKYTLRTKSLLKRIESERSRQSGKKKEPKEKQKPPPLSKYRRKTANARERNRMKEINEAFETLQKTLPNLPGTDAEKLTKITVLKLAVNYIKALARFVDGEFLGPTDIDDLREMWCLDNAHMARPEHCVRPISKRKSQQQTQIKTIRFTPLQGSKPSIKTIPKCKTNLVSEVCPISKDKIVPQKKKSKSRTRGKVCKTASIATSNGAYITLKNVAFQTPSSRRHIPDNKPLMMSMTVKRPRMESISFHRPMKIAKIEPSPPPVVTVTQPHIGFMAYGADPSYVRMPTLGSDAPDNILIPQLTFMPTEAQTPLSNTYYTYFPLQDPEKMVTKTEAIQECQKADRHSSLSSIDSAFFSEGSLPPSPIETKPCLTSLGQVSPSDSSNSISTVLSSCRGSDTDSVLTASTELENILNVEPFDDELDHLASSFTSNEDPLHLLLDQTPSNFFCSDMNGCCGC